MVAVRSVSRLAVGVVVAGLAISAECLAEEAEVTRIGCFGDSAYYVTSPLSFEEGRACATALGAALGRPAHLASITSDAEQMYLLGLLGSPSVLWIGLERLPGFPRNEHRWAWDSGEPYSYADAFWCAGEPSDQNGEESVGVFGWGPGGCWNDGFAPIANSCLIEVEGCSTTATREVSWGRLKSSYYR